MVMKFNRGFHIITQIIIEEVKDWINNIPIGLAHIFIKHTSASLIINEAADPTVRSDFESYFNELVPENKQYFLHTMEGPDDMPAHIKSSILGSSLEVPITNGILNIGTWQGIFLCEHRNHLGRGRSLVLTARGK